MKAYALTDVGKKRTTNQDYVYISIEPVGNLPNLFIVADGMGGHKAGDVASRFTVDSIVEFVKSNEKKDPFTILEEGITKVNLELIEKAKESINYEGMGTTLVIATAIDNMLYIANIGDSRLYLLKDELRQITRDHSYVEEMVTSGEIDKKEARTHAKKNIITRAVGAEKNIEADYFQVDINKQDKVLMCTDGLTNMIEDNDIKDIISSNDDISDIVHNLISRANDNGGKDNVSAVLISL